MPSLDMAIIDAFTAEPFAGNPAAVCFLENNLDDVTMQKIAREMNQSETAFIRRSGSRFHLRWFTPTAEIKLCGHATLASSHYLWAREIAARDQKIYFDTLSGELVCEEIGDDMIRMDFPILHPKLIEPDELQRSLFRQPRHFVRDETNLIVELQSEDEVRNYKPDFAKIAQVDAQGVVITASATEGYDFCSRYFAVRIGINEDPVTGATHCGLAPYWQSKLNKTKFKARQLSQRGGTLHIEVKGDRVLIAGQVCETLRGRLDLPL